MENPRYTENELDEIDIRSCEYCGREMAKMSLRAWLKLGGWCDMCGGEEDRGVGVMF